jgi:DNA-binding transcriptional MerR regulator
MHIGCKPLFLLVIYYYNHNVIVWRAHIGTAKLKIGELAEITSMTKRTIDHYTNLGLLKAERSTSNYRYYDRSSVERLDFIERCKKEGMPLAEIKKKILEKEAEEIDILELRLKMKGLEKDVSKVLASLDKGDIKKLEFVKKNISHESLSLIQTLLLLLN